MKSVSKTRDYHHENLEKIERLDRKLANFGVKIRKDADSQKVTNDVFDETTLLSLYRLVGKKVISSIGGSISTGKEANVFFAERIDGTGVGIEAAVKLYRLRTGNFTVMSEYILGDPRFSNIRHTHKDIIFAWTKKEYSNLVRAREADILCPEPFAFERNILIMEFLGKNGVPYPQMRKNALKNPGETYQDVIDLIRNLYQKARLVHGDLSEYNILVGHDDLILIDMAQAVTLEHPNAHNFLFRDIRNINRFFAQKCKTVDEHKLFRSIVGEQFFEI
jgi:RIO kinase 1